MALIACSIYSDMYFANGSKVPSHNCFKILSLFACISGSIANTIAVQILVIWAEDFKLKEPLSTVNFNAKL